jgi:hypothetical protein
MVFVVGNSRSGTTMMARILGRNSAIFSFGELHFFEQMVSPDEFSSRATLGRSEAVTMLAKLISIQRDGFFARRQPERYADEARALVFEEVYPAAMDCQQVFKAFLTYESRLHGRQIACEQTPRNVFYLQEILEAYPEARVITMVRDPRDVLLSQKNKWRRRFLGAKNIPITEAFRAWVNYHPITIAKLWNASVGAAWRYENHPRVITVRYEALVANPEKEVARVCALLGVEFQKEMLAVPKVGSSVRPDTPGGAGIDSSRVGSWQAGGLSMAEISTCQQITAKWLAKFGYVVVDTGWAGGMKIFYLLTFPIKLGLALLLNLNRTRNLMQTIRRRLVGASSMGAS